LAEHAKAHAYAKRFEAFLKKRFGKAEGGKKKRARTLGLKIIHELDGQTSAKRAIVVQSLLAENYQRSEVDKMILALHQEGLIESKQGPHS
jgi:hypothetical protein